MFLLSTFSVYDYIFGGASFSLIFFQRLHFDNFKQLIQFPFRTIFLHLHNCHNSRGEISVEFSNWLHDTHTHTPLANPWARTRVLIIPLQEHFYFAAHKVRANDIRLPAISFWLIRFELILYYFTTCLAKNMRGELKERTTKITKKKCWFIQNTNKCL